jgi:hypothetical protein
LDIEHSIYSLSSDSLLLLPLCCVLCITYNLRSDITAVGEYISFEVDGIGGLGKYRGLISVGLIPLGAIIHTPQLVTANFTLHT